MQVHVLMCVPFLSHKLACQLFCRLTAHQHHVISLSCRCEADSCHISCVTMTRCTGRGAGPSSQDVLAKLRQRNALAASDGAEAGDADPQVGCPLMYMFRKTIFNHIQAPRINMIARDSHCCGPEQAPADASITGQDCSRPRQHRAARLLPPCPMQQLSSRAEHSSQARVSPAQALLWTEHFLCSTSSSSDASEHHSWEAVVVCSLDEAAEALSSLELALGEL